MIKYLSYISGTLSLKNKLEKAIYEFLKSQERKVIQESSIEDFKKIIISGIENLNIENQRCKPIEVSWWSFNNYGDFHLSGAGFCNFNLYKSKN